MKIVSSEDLVKMSVEIFTSNDDKIRFINTCHDTSLDEEFLKIVDGQKAEVFRTVFKGIENEMEY